MSIKPKLVCPPDYSILALRFTECKKIGIVKGITTLASTDLSSFYIPITNFSDKKFTVKAGKKLKLEIGDIASYWNLKESYLFLYEDAYVSDGTSHAFTMFDEAGSTLIGTISFTIDALIAGYEDFPTAFDTALKANTVLATAIDVTYEAGLSEFIVIAKTVGTKFTYLMEYDTDGFGGSTPFPYLHPGNLVEKNEKYPNGRVRAIFLYAEYAKVNTSKCGCTDTSGDMLSNVKNFEWAYDNDYTQKQSLEYITNVQINANSSLASQQNLDGTQTFQWLTTGDAPGYYLQVGDLITISSSINNPYAYITNINGYSITIDRQGLGNGADTIVKKYSPANIQWRIGGEMLFISGGQDVYDTDRLYTETIWINNTHNYDLPFTAIIVS